MSSSWVLRAMTVHKMWLHAGSAGYGAWLVARYWGQAAEMKECPVLQPAGFGVWCCRRSYYRVAGWPVMVAVKKNRH